MLDLPDHRCLRALRRLRPFPRLLAQVPRGPAERELQLAISRSGQRQHEILLQSQVHVRLREVSRQGTLQLKPLGCRPIGLYQLLTWK